MVHDYLRNINNLSGEILHQKSFWFSYILQHNSDASQYELLWK